MTPPEATYDNRAVVLDDSGVVLHIAERATRALAQDWLECIEGTLTPTYAADRDAFAAALARVLYRPLGVSGPVTIPLRTRDGMPGGVVTLYRLNPRTDRELHSPRAAVVAILKPETVERPDPVSLMQFYGLTKSEASLLADLVVGFDVTGHADRRQISPHTVRSTLKSVFAKTHTNRQTTLIQRVTRTFDAEI